MNASPQPRPAESEARLPIELHLERDDLVVWRHRGTSGRLALSFSGIGPKDGTMPPIEFARIATAGGLHNALFIIDPKRTWLNGDGLIERIADIVRAFAENVGAEETVALGHSMGGFAAIVMSGFIPMKSAVAFSPQVSVHPDIAGDDPRWMYFRRHITRHRLGSAADHMVPETAYHVFHGANVAERPQRDRFPVAANLSHLVLPRITHQVPQKLKEVRLLGKVVRAALNNRARIVRETLKPLGAHRRTLDTYPILPPSAECA
ncbi:MAG: hypothetical protein D6801_00585 [Alphaproteobacteria bacterium]|nr:MAG: hypothetical protein D6801_00585 [Alphaproteobacteria bacterium]